jgi:Fe-S cluster assembly protein SufD
MAAVPEAAARVDATGRPPMVPAPAAPVRSRDPEAHPVPTGREEAWRFTPLRPLKALIAGQEPDGKIDITVTAPDGVEVEHISFADHGRGSFADHGQGGTGDPRVGRVLTPVDRVAAFATARAGGVLAVTVPAEAELTEPVLLALRGDGGVCYSHLAIEVGPFASATVVLDHTGSAKYAGNVEVYVGHGASVTFVSLQDWADDTVHAGAHAFSLGRDARLRATHITLGGQLVRLCPTVDYRGPGGDAELSGLFFTDAGQHQEHRLLVTHQERSCRSRVTYKGALQGADAHSVWIGDVLIGADAVGTDTYEVNRNLVLTDGARADSVPNLEILTGEVIGAGHASATGRFDDEALFYLMARGIPADEARRLVVRGFFGEVLDRVGVEALRDRVTAAVDAELSAVGA